MSNPLSPESPGPTPAPGTWQTPEPNVWPPPPSGLPPALQPPVYGPPPFSPLRGLSVAVCLLLGLYAAVSLVGLAATLLLPAASQEILDSVVTLFQFLLLLSGGVCFLIWTYRLTANLRSFGVPGLKHTPGWAVGYFFVPIMSLYRPYQIFREIWQGSDPAAPAAPDWRKLPVPPLLGLWWFFWILTNMVGNLSARTADTQGLDHHSIDLVDNAIGFVSALLALWMVRRVTARQEAAARTLGV